jgi:hypothetical protein
MQQIKRQLRAREHCPLLFTRSNRFPKALEYASLLVSLVSQYIEQTHGAHEGAMLSADAVQAEG